MKISLHDNSIYAQLVDHNRRTIVLYTTYQHSEPHEFTDVLFTGVLVHHFETQQMNGGEHLSANIIFDIEEADASLTLKLYWDFIQSKKNYAWPMTGWETREELANQLSQQGHRCYHIHGTIGLDGFVFAKSMAIQARKSMWVSEAGQNDAY